MHTHTYTAHTPQTTRARGYRKATRSSVVTPRGGAETEAEKGDPGAIARARDGAGTHTHTRHAHAGTMHTLTLSHACTHVHTQTCTQAHTPQATRARDIVRKHAALLSPPPHPQAAGGDEHPTHQVLPQPLRVLRLRLQQWVLAGCKGQRHPHPHNDTHTATDIQSRTHNYTHSHTHTTKRTSQPNARHNKTPSHRAHMPSRSTRLCVLPRAPWLPDCEG